MATASLKSDQNLSTGSNTAVSSPSLIPVEMSASSYCSGTTNGSSGPSQGSPCACPGSPRAASTFASSIHSIRDGTAHLYLTPMTASLTAAPPHSAFTAPHFSAHNSTAAAAATSSADVYARDSGSPDCGALDTEDYSCGAGRNPTNARAALREHSPLPLMQQSGSEMRPRPSFTPESPASIASPAHLPLANTPLMPPPPEPQASVCVPAAAVTTPVPDVPSAKPVSSACRPLAPLPVVHQRPQSLRVLEDGQHGTWSCNSSSTPAGSSASSGATSPSVATAPQSSSRSDHSRSRARTGAFPLGKAKECEGVATTAPQQQGQQQESGGSDAPLQSRQCLGQRDDLLGASMCSLSMASVTTSMVYELPPPPPSAQLPLRRGAETDRGKSFSSSTPPRVSFPLRRLLCCLDGAESHSCATSHAHSSDYSTADGIGDSHLNASTASGRQSSVTSSRLWESTGSMKPFMLSHVTTSHRSVGSSILIPSVTMPGTSMDGIGLSDANKLASYLGARHSGAVSQEQPPHGPSSATSHNDLLVSVHSPVNADGVETEDIVEFQQAVAPPLSLPDRSSVPASAGILPLFINGPSDPLGTPVQSSESSAPRPQPPSGAGKTTRRVSKADSSEDLNSKPSSAAASGKSKLQLATAIVQAPSLVSSEASAHARFSKAQALSSRQQELAQSFRNRIQVGVRAPRRQRTVQRVSSPSRNGSTASNGTSRNSIAERSSITRPRGDSFRRTKGQSTQQPVAALSFMAAALAAVATAKLLRPVHALRVRRRFDEVIAPAAAYRIQCKWRRCLQLRRVEQKTAVQLLVPWMRRRLQRLRRAKEASARLLQRVFRGEVVRSFHRYLYQQMKRGHALAVIRRYVQRWEAQDLYRGLQAQRDERAVVVGRCVQGYLRLFRAEQVEWSAIVQDGIAALQHRPCVSTQDWVEGVAALTGVVLDPFVSNRIRSTNASPAMSTRPRPTTVAQLRELVADLARLEHQLFRSSSIEAEKTVSSREGSAHSSTGLQRPRPTRLTDDAWEGGLVTARDADPSCTAASTASVGASGSPTPSSPAATGNDFVAAYVQLLCRTEATERVELERRLLGEYQDFLRGPLLLNKALFYATTMRVPPLFSSLLLDMPSDVALHQAARLLKAERKARFEIIQLYESMPLACLRRPMLSPAANARQTDLVRLLSGVDDPWGDAESSERCFYREVAAYKHLVSPASTTSKLESGAAVIYTPQPSSASLGANDADGARSPRETKLPQGPTHSDGGCHLPTAMMPPLPSVQQSTSYDTPSRLRVRMKVTSLIHYYSNSPDIASLPSHATSLFPCPNNSAESSAPGGGGVPVAGEDNRHTNCLALTRHCGGGDAQSRTAIASPHRRLRGPPLPLLRKLLRSPGRARSGAPHLSRQPVSVVATPTLSSREGASGLRPPFSAAYPNATHSTLADIRTPATAQGERETAVGAAGSAQRFTSTRLTGVAAGSDRNQGCSCNTNGISQDADGVAPRRSGATFVGCIKTQLAGEAGLGSRPLATAVVPLLKMHDATAVAPGPLPRPSTAHEVPHSPRQQNRAPIPTRVSENASDAATPLKLTLPLLWSPAGTGASRVSAIAAAAAAEVADRRCATRWSIDGGPSLPQTPLSVRSEPRDPSVETGGDEADTELHRGQRHQQSSTTATAACPVQVPTPLESCRLEAVDFPPSPVLSSSASMVAQAVADGRGLVNPAPLRRRPPTPPPRQCHAADHVGEPPERRSVHSVFAPHPANRAGTTITHNVPASTESLASSDFHQPQHLAAAHSDGSTVNTIGANSSEISSSNANWVIKPTPKQLPSPAVRVAAAAVASTAQCPSLFVR
ncbi:hypothetical protein JIQ42_05896 [Leishmania sp. Namibia]|uniref:hypothetical protein n=1 Tax=Leishmania sp. Namibia TaxID=2802991 RepID=UPI001B4E1DB5|nr:hypothetical protein JIQ42_05896 [Leishmania sp. Namibia]